MVDIFFQHVSPSRVAILDIYFFSYPECSIVGSWLIYSGNMQVYSHLMMTVLSKSSVTAESTSTKKGASSVLDPSTTNRRKLRAVLRRPYRRCCAA
ncbi:hypothetical protein A0H81_05990 [Grifola frondosa]|uniref:Uncharacterized protein n=1 Tax=Grifola frondosa TaxID=5627 RepID=A0A1C7MAZ7_GRIFR|nr:hypothetical protein A0H81_05990 [Grifola frondosa]